MESYRVKCRELLSTLNREDQTKHQLCFLKIQTKTCAVSKYKQKHVLSQNINKDMYSLKI